MRPERYIIMCRVSGGVTGTREAVLKHNDMTRLFTSEMEARLEALRLDKQMNGNPYKTADFQYWPVRLGQEEER
jgi:hypothetical protein